MHIYWPQHDTYAFLYSMTKTWKMRGVGHWNMDDEIHLHHSVLEDEIFQLLSTNSLNYHYKFFTFVLPYKIDDKEMSPHCTVEDLWY